MPRTNLACSICVHDDIYYLAETIRSVGEAVPVFVFVSRLAWHDDPGDWEQTVRIAEAAGAEVVVGEWEDAQPHRHDAQAWLTSRRFTHALALDSDQILDAGLRDTLLKLAKSGLAERVTVEMDTYWNSPEYVIRPRLQLRPEVLLDLRVTRPVTLRNYEGGRVLHLSADYGVMHHLSYIGPDERMARKMRTSDRRFEWQPFWWEQVWQGWKEDRLLRDLHPTHREAYGFAERIRVPAALDGVYQQWLTLTGGSDRQVGLREGVLAGAEAPSLPEEKLAAKRRSTRKRKPAGATLSIVIPLHGGPEEIRQCLESLERSRDLIHEVVVVDDASPDDAPAEVEKLPWVKFVRQEAQQGFAATCNRGLAEASGALVLFLNSDTVVPRSGLQQLVEAIEKDPQIGAVGPYTNHAAYGQALPCTYTTLDTLDLFAEDFAERSAADLDTDMLVGFCVLVRRQVLDAVGSFDTRFGPGMFEDNDLCYRMRRAGYRLVVAARSFVHHHGSRTMVRTGMDMQAQRQQNGRLFHDKWRADLESGFASHLPGMRPEPIRFDPPRDPALHSGTRSPEQVADVSSSTSTPRATPGTVSAFVEGFEAALKNREWSTAEGYLGGVRDAEGCSVTWTQMAVRLAAAAGDDPDRFLARCLDTAPGEVGPRLILARRLLQRGREAEAEPHLMHLQQQGVAEAAYYLGIFALRCGERHAALGWMERARELNPGHAPTQEQIATLQRELGHARVLSAPVV